MNASRAAVMVVGVNLMAVWAAAAAGGRAGRPPGPADAIGLTQDREVVEARSALVEATGRLRRHGGPPAGSAAVVRDPFRFGGEVRPSPARESSAIGTVTAEPAGLPPAAPPVPDILLQGMAETGEGLSLVRTAILNAGGELVLAAIGTRVGGRYTVAALGADSVELEDVQGGPRRIIRMK